MVDKTLPSLYKGLLYWFVGAMTFFAVELLCNFKAGRVFVSPTAPITIILIYLLAVCLGGVFFGRLHSGIKRKFSALRIDIETWLWISFFIFWLFIYVVLWVNDKNPYTFFAPISIAANIALLFIFIIPSLLIYKIGGWLKKKAYQDFFLVFLAFCVACSTYIIFSLELNWQRYRLSVEKAERFITEDLLLFNLYLLLGSTLLFITAFYLMKIVKKILPRFTLNKFALITATVVVILILTLMSVQSILPKKENKLLGTAPGLKNPPNVILIVIDAVRSSQLSCYGYPWPTSPNIDRLASEGFLFENCISQFTHTKTAIPSLLSSQYVTLSRLQDKKFMQNLQFLQEYLSRMNYFNLLFIGGNFTPGVIAGTDRGFDYCPTQWGSYYDYFLPRIGVTLYKVAITRKYEASAWVAHAEKLVDKFSAWLNQNQQLSFFAYFDFQNSHSPYPVPASYKRHFFSGDHKQAYQLGEEWELKQDKIEKEKVDDVIALYDDAIRYQDNCIGLILEHLKKLGLYDRTLIIVTADHGDSFLEHGTTHHAHSLYDEIIKVPLIVKLPGTNEPKRIEHLVALADITPTILDFLNIANDNGQFQGRSLLPLCRGEDRAVADSRYTISLKQSNFIGIRTKRWKLVFADEAKKALFGTREIGHRAGKELFDLETDPGELENVYERYKQEGEIRALEQILQKYKELLYDEKAI